MAVLRQPNRRRLLRPQALAEGVEETSKTANGLRELRPFTTLSFRQNLKARTTKTCQFCKDRQVFLFLLSIPQITLPQPMHTMRTRQSATIQVRAQNANNAIGIEPSIPNAVGVDDHQRAVVAGVLAAGLQQLGAFFQLRVGLHGFL